MTNLQWPPAGSFVGEYTGIQKKWKRDITPSSMAEKGKKSLLLWHRIMPAIFDLTQKITEKLNSPLKIL